VETQARALTVRQISVRGINLALQRPVQTAGGVMASTPLVLIDLQTEDGVSGRSYVRCYTTLALDPLVRLISNIAALLKGKSAAPAVVEGTLHRSFRLLGAQGLVRVAMAGIDMALWDALARARGVPLVTLLGGQPGRIPAYASLRTMEPDDAAREAAELVGQGFKALKVKVGRGDLAADVETIRALRNAVGDGVTLMVDYNQSLSVADAIARVRVLDELDLYWIEEPTRADDFEGHARIAAAARTPIQLGENWDGPHEMMKSLRAEASDHVVLDVMKLGGVTGWLRAASLADAHSRLVSSHTFVEFSAHLLGVTPTAHWLEYLDHAGVILQEPLRAEGGFVTIPDRPGAGLEWNERAIRSQLER
jgi:mandelate racemase